MNNYERSRDRSQAYFLSFDQEAIVQSLDLKQDAAWIYAYFLGRPYAICRETGKILRLWSREQADFNEVLSIFDLLCHEGEEKHLSGQFAPVNSLNGRPRAAGVGTDFHRTAAEQFDRDPEAFCRACKALGGTPVGMGDIGFQFPIYKDITVILKFYRADEDFPASVTLLWDANMLQFVFYETVFYIAGFLLNAIAEQMHLTE